MRRAARSWHAVGVMVTLLTEGDLDRGRSPDLASPHWRCRIVDHATGALPILTVEQRDEALRKAQAARLARKQLLQAIAAGEQTIPAVLDRAKTDTVIGRTKVVDLLKSLPGWGPAKAAALLEQTGIASSRRAAGLGERQRQTLVDALTGVSGFGPGSGVSEGFRGSRRCPG